MAAKIDGSGGSRPRVTTPNQADYRERQQQKEQAARTRPSIPQEDYRAQQRTAPTTVSQADYQERQRAGQQFLRLNPDLDFSPAAVAQRERAVARKESVNPYNFADRIAAAAIAENTQRLPGGMATSVASSLARKESLLDYPTLLGAAYRSGLSNDEIRRVVNFAEAHKAATALTNTIDPERANVIFSSMSGPMQAAVVDILKAAQDNPSLVKGTEEKSSFVGSLVEAAFDGLLWVNEQGQHFARAGLAARNDLLSTDSDVSVMQRVGALAAWGSGAFLGSSNSAYWDATEKGKYDEKRLGELRTQYGEKPVNVILRANQIAADGEPDAVGRWIKEFENDPDALKIIDSVIFRRNDSVELLKLTDLVDATHMGNYGFLATNLYTPDELKGSELQNQTANAANVAAFFLYDPTLLGSKARAGYIAGRYGLHKLSGGADSVEKAFKMRQVRRFYDSLGKDLSKADGAMYGDEATYMARVKKKYGSWLDEVTIEEMRAFGVKSSDDAMRYYMDTDMALGILRGQAIRRTKYIPHANMLATARRSVTGVRGISPKARGASGMYGMSGWTRGGNSVDRQDQAARVADTLITQADKIGAAEGIGFRSGRGVTITKAGGRKGLRVYGEFNGFTYNDKTLAARVDRFMRRGARMPNGANGISIVDASDAKRVYDYARAFLTKYHANIIRQAWVDGNPATRLRIMQGLNRSAGYAKGIHLRDPENGYRIIDDLSFGTRASDQYAATQAGIMGERLGAVAAPVDVTSARYAVPQVRPTGDAAKDRMIRSLNLELRDNIARQNEIRASMKDARGEINVREAMEELKALRQERLQISKDMRVIQQGTGEVAARTARAAARKSTPKGQNAADQVTAGKAAAVDAQAKQAAADLRSVNRQIDKLEKKAGDQSSRLQELYRIRDELRREGGTKYFENRALLAERRRIEKIASDDFARFDPSLVNGRSYAIFPWQVSSRVAIPRWDLIESARARTSVLDQVMGVTQSGAVQLGVDFWTFGTLASPRFAVRNAIEDYLFYFGTRGNVKDLQTGRMASTGTREARGVVQPAIAGGKIRGPETRQGLGIVNRRLRKIGDRYAKKHGVVGEFIARMFSANLDPKDVKAARDALSAGNRKPMEDLTAYAMYRLKFSRIIPGTQEDKFLREFASVQGHRALDEVTDTARYLTDATLPGVSTAWKDVAGAKQVPIYRSMYTGDYKDLALTPNNHAAFERLYADISRTVEGSRSIGKIAVAGLASNAGKGGEAARSARVIKRIAEKVKDDPWYRQNMGILYETGMSEEQFATRFYYAVRGLFAGPDGRLNVDLLKKIVREETDANGKKFPSVKMRDGDVPRVTVSDLQKYDSTVLPDQVLGREMITVPVFDDMNFMDRIYKIMGEMNGRFSREPILFANYLDVRKQVAASGLEERLIAAGMSPEKANAQVVRMSIDNAFERTMMYTDNPEIRTLFAWNMRNVARFYRATEDFYRRASRLVKTNPDALWKAALTYDVIGHSGFTYTDENGEKYFIYPGTNVMFDAMANLIGMTNGSQRGFAAPTIFGGRVTMLTPSLDPNAWFPTFSGPLAAFPLKLVLDRFPAARGIEKALLGTYASESDVWNALIPPPIMRAVAILSKDERYSQYASAYKNAVQIATAAGLAPDAATLDDSESSEMAKNKYLERVGNIATHVLYMRFILGFFVPASPQALPNDITEFARKMGTSGGRQLFLEFSNQYDSVEEASAAWFKLNPDYMPYSISKSEDGPNVNRKSALQPTREVVDWLVQNEGFVRRFPTSSTFIAPTGGAYDPSAMGLLEAMGFKQPKSSRDFAFEVMTQEGWYIWSQTKKDYQERVAATTDKGEKARLKDAWSAAQEDLFSRFSGLRVRVAPGDGKVLAQETLDQSRKMLDFMYADGSPMKPNASSEVISKMIATFDDANLRISTITGSTDPEDAEKRRLRTALRSALNDMSAGDVNAERFYQTVLDPLMED